MDDRPEKKLVFESALDSALGGKNKGLQFNVRISPEMNRALEEESKRRNQSVSDLARDSIAFGLIPGFLKSKLQGGAGLDSKDRALLDACRAYLSEVSEACGKIDGTHRKIQRRRVDRKVRRYIERMDPMIDKKIEEAVDRAIKKVFEKKKGGIK